MIIKGKHYRTVWLKGSTVYMINQTAQNLFYSLERVYRAIKEAPDPHQAKTISVREAEAIAQEDINACKKIGGIGAKLAKDNFKILTHFNAGWLAFTCKEERWIWLS